MMRGRSLFWMLAANALVCAAALSAEETTGFRFYDEQGALLNDVTVAFHTGTVSSKMAPQQNGLYTLPVGPGGKVSFRFTGPVASYGSTDVVVPDDLSGPLDVVLEPSGAGNADCTQAEEIEVFDSVSGDTSVDGGPQTAPFCGTSVTADGVWFTVDGTGGTMTASTCDQAGYDTKLNVYCADCDNFVCVNGNDDGPGCSAFTSEISWCSRPMPST